MGAGEELGGYLEGGETDFSVFLGHVGHDQAVGGLYVVV